MTAKEEKTVRPDFDFAGMLTAWQKRCGRHDLPWQQTKDAYRVWLSEIMLQQTQVATVIPYYARFLAQFPTVQALAAAPPDAVMAQWSGLGYYSRARNLHLCAQRVVKEYGGHFPMEPLLLEKLPGIGRSTAAAIAVFSGGRRAAIMDGNVVRVFARVFGIAEYAGDRKVRDRLWALAESLLPETELAAYTQGLMDLGATVCTRSRPACGRCPFFSCCTALREGRIDELPAKKPAKALPCRQVFMLVMAKEGKVLLEKRPDSGIWGGCFRCLSWWMIFPKRRFCSSKHVFCRWAGWRIMRCSRLFCMCLHILGCVLCLFLSGLPARPGRMPPRRICGAIWIRWRTLPCLRL